MKRVVLIVAVLLLAGAAFMAGQRHAQSKPAGRTVLYYVDPMHPAYRSDKPGIAPDCGMKLEPVYAEGAQPATTAKVLYYTDPKEPGYRSDTPGINPATGNDLEPVHEGAAPAGTISVSAEKQQLIGVKFAGATLAASTEIIRAAGTVAANETKITRVHPRIEGWIHKVHVDFTGQRVAKGDPLLTIYSPEMLASQNEYLLALRARDTMKSGPSHDAYENSELLIVAGRRRLELWDLSAGQIDEIERTRKPIQTVTVYSPASGYITARNAFPSQRVSPETELYAITDLSQVWIMANVFETDLAKVRIGQTATVSIPNEGRSFTAKVTYLQPQIDPATRTMKVRLDAANPQMRLKPDMFANVEFPIALPTHVTVPADAVVNTGARKTVFVDRGNGAIEPRAVETGERNGDRIVILRGIAAGERVVAAGTFLLDSETQLKGGGR